MGRFPRWGPLARLRSTCPVLGQSAALACIGVLTACADEAVPPSSTSGVDASVDDAGQPEGNCRGFAGGKQRIVSIAAASVHTCAVWSDGKAWCWGDNSS